MIAKIIIIAIIALLIVFDIIYLYHNKGHNLTCSGCTGDCSNCEKIKNIKKIFSKNKSTEE